MVNGNVLERGQKRSRREKEMLLANNNQASQGSQARRVGRWESDNQQVVCKRPRGLRQLLR